MEKENSDAFDSSADSERYSALAETDSGSARLRLLFLIRLRGRNINSTNSEILFVEFERETFDYSSNRSKGICHFSCRLEFTSSSSNCANLPIVTCSSKCKFRLGFILTRNSWTASDRNFKLSLQSVEHVFAWLGVKIDLDEIECIVANLIANKKLNGYISHKHRVVVLARNNAFPRIP